MFSRSPPLIGHQRDRWAMKALACLLRSDLPPRTNSICPGDAFAPDPLLLQLLTPHFSPVAARPTQRERGIGCQRVVGAAIGLDLSPVHSSRDAEIDLLYLLVLLKISRFPLQHGAAGL